MSSSSLNIEKVFSGTLGRLNKYNISREIMVELYDIDTEDNLYSWMHGEPEKEFNPVREFVKEYFGRLKTLK